MQGPVYNFAIPSTILHAVNRVLRSAPCVCVAAQLSAAILGLTIAAHAADWNTPEQQLAGKIVAVTGRSDVGLTFENRSSLSRRDAEIIQNGLRSAIAGAGLRIVQADHAPSTITISLSENLESYIWIAEIRRDADEVHVTLVSIPRPETSTAARDSVPLSVRKILLWTQADPILDVAVLEENATPTRLAVLDPEKVTVYRLQSGTWQQEQALGIVHTRPWPRDLRGRLVPAKDHLLDVYLPSAICHSTAGVPLALNCREEDDPWPLVPVGFSTGNSNGVTGTVISNNASVAIPPMEAFFAPARNFFTGVLTAGVGKFTAIPKFYSAAVLPREKSVLWLFVATDGEVRMVDGVSDQPANFGWGSDIASVKTSCGAGWQLLAASSGEQIIDSVRAYEFPQHDPIAVSAALDLPGTISALWTEAKGDTAVVVVRNQETGSYEAFRLALACNQ